MMPQQNSSTFSFKSTRSAIKFNQLLFGFIAIFIASNFVSFVLFQIKPELFYFRSYEFCGKFDCTREGWNGRETGDLSRDFAFLYQESWPTNVSFDKFGFRQVPACTSPAQILIWGDSYIKGAGLSDNETLPWQIGLNVNVPTYNSAGNWLGDTLAAPHLSEVKIIIEARIDRTVGANFPKRQLKINTFQMPTEANPPHQGVFNLTNPARWNPWFKIKRFTTNFFKDVTFLWLHNGTIPTKLYEEWSTSKEKINQTINGIRQHAEFLTSQGYTYIFVLIPSKQSIYGQDDNIIPQPLTLEVNDIFMSELEKYDVRTIDLKTTFKDHKSIGQLYFNTDSHWEPYGVSIAAQAISSYLHEQGLLKSLQKCN